MLLTMGHCRWSRPCPLSARPVVIHILRMRAMGTDMLLHIILPRKRLVTDRTMHALLAGMFLAMSGCMAGCRERRGTPMAGSVGTGVFVLPNASSRVLGSTQRGRCLW